MPYEALFFTIYQNTKSQKKETIREYFSTVYQEGVKIICGYFRIPGKLKKK